MKTLVYLAIISFGSAATAAEIQTTFADGSNVSGFHESFQAKPTSKLCFTGNSDQICKDLRSSVAHFNQALAEEGAESRVVITACAQSIKRAMVMYTLKPVGENALVRRTAYLRECQ